MSCYANVKEIFPPKKTHNHVLEAWAQNGLFGCLICYARSILGATEGVMWLPW